VHKYKYNRKHNTNDNKKDLNIKNMRIKVSQLGLVRISIYRFTDYEHIYSVLNIINIL